MKRPDFDVMAQSGTWDQATRAVVLARVQVPAELRFFTSAEASTARPLLDRLLALDGEPVPVLAMIDRRLADGIRDGWRYEEMPQDDQTWRRSLAALDADAVAAHGQGFDELSADQQHAVIDAVRDTEDWHGLPGARVWELWQRHACWAFYSHPWAWSEIGFGGPAYPRGYKNLGLDRREPWEHDTRGGRPA